MTGYKLFFSDIKPGKIFNGFSLLLLFLNFSLGSQNGQVDSLVNRLKNIPEDTNKVNILTS